MISKELENKIWGSYGVADHVYGYNSGHSFDQQSAKEAIALAAKEGVSLEEFVGANEKNLKEREGDMTTHRIRHIQEQLEMVRQKASKKLK